MLIVEVVMSRRITIGQLAEVTGVPPKTIRYYEEIGILPTADRNEARYRVYSEADVRRLDLIRRARTLEMPLIEVRELVEWASSGTCDDFHGRFLDVVRRKLLEIDKRIDDLEHLKQDLKRLEAHFIATEKEVNANHTVLECSPDTCTCLGSIRDDKEQKQEVLLWLNKPG